MVVDQLSVLFFELLRPFLGFLTFFRQGLEDELAVSHVLSHQLVLLSVCHVLDRGLDVSIERLQVGVLLRHDILLVQELLQSLVVALLGIEGHPLQLGLVLVVVQHCLREQDVRRDRMIKVVELRPPFALDLHHVKHVPIEHVLFGGIHVLGSHVFEQFVFAGCQVVELLLRLERDGADLRPPLFHVVRVLLDPLLFVLPQPIVFDHRVSIPVVLFVLISQLRYLLTEMLRILDVAEVDSPFRRHFERSQLCLSQGEWPVFVDHLP